MPVSTDAVVNSPSPAVEAAVVVVNTPFVKTARAIYIGGAGNATLLMPNGADSIEFAGLTAGTILPVRCLRVTAATATNMVALF